VTRPCKPGAPIAEESRRCAAAVADSLGYRPNLLARCLATRPTQQAAVLVDDSSDPGFGTPPLLCPLHADKHRRGSGRR
jgi:DNA-binding LacI/PurR family transcriptional regulator